jgi:hypothetical protein
VVTVNELIDRLQAIRGRTPDGGQAVVVWGDDGISEPAAGQVDLSTLLGTHPTTAAPAAAAPGLAGLAEPPRVVRLTVVVHVHEPARLRAYARRRYAACWGEDGWEADDLGEAAYEALVASNENRAAALDYGVELGERGWTVEPAPPPGVPPTSTRE